MPKRTLSRTQGALFVVHDPYCDAARCRARGVEATHTLTMSSETGISYTFPICEKSAKDWKDAPRWGVFGGRVTKMEEVSVAA